MSSERKPFRALGRDLYFDLRCDCPHPRLTGVRNTVKLTGYADSHFFDTVNAEPRTGACACGRRYQHQWFRDGVEAKWLK